MVSYVDKIAHTGAGKGREGRRRGIRLELQSDGVVEKFHTKNGPAAGRDWGSNFHGFDGGFSRQSIFEGLNLDSPAEAHEKDSKFVFSVRIWI